MSNLRTPDSIGDWSTTQLVKFIRDLLQNQPPDFLPLLKAEEVEVHKQLTLLDKVVVVRESDFRLIARPGQPGFTNTWGNFGGGWRLAGFWRDPLGVVRLRGLISAGVVGQSAFTLPPGFRPGLSETFATLSNGAIGRVSVYTDGTVVPEAPSTNVWVSLSGISFRIN